MIIYFIGYRGTGKTTVAQAVSQQLGWEWFDADQEIQETAGMSIAEIFALEGEQGFRRREAKVVELLSKEQQAIVALGGGAIMSGENRDRLKASGKCVWFTASIETIYDRMQDDAVSPTQRPRLTSLSEMDEIRQVLEERLPLYQRCSDCVIETDDKSPLEIAHEVVEQIKLWQTS